MTNQHPITPPPDLVQRWIARYEKHSWDPQIYADLLSCAAARWGADQELEACCEVLSQELVRDGKNAATDLRIIRRPKPPTLKEQALDELTSAERLYPADWSTIRRAIEALPND
jgi:hypothetical protein